MVVGFYLLVALVAGALVLAPLLDWLIRGEMHVELLVAVALGLGLLWTLVPRREPFTPPGPRIEREDQPELWSLIEKICTVMHEKVPAEIYLLGDMNAYVADVRGVLGFGGRRVMGLGVPLMRVLDTEEFGAVIAHELGHFQAGSTRLGPFVHRTRSAIARTLAASEGSLSHLVFTRYARLYMRVTRKVGEAQELSADARAAAATSPQAIAGALARLPFGTVALDVYRRTEYVPVLESGHQPPFLEGFDTFLTSSVAQQHLRVQADAAFGSTTHSELDAHPPVPVRLRALGFDVADHRERPLPEVPAVRLLRALEAVEAQIVARQLSTARPLTPIAWSDVGRRVLAPTWGRERASLIGELPPGFHLGALPVDRDGLAELGEDVGRHLGRSLSRPEQESYGHHVARAIIGELAVAHGLDVEMIPGEPVWFGRSPDQFGLFSAYDDVVEGRAGPEVWYDVLLEAGLVDRRMLLGSEAEAEDASPAVDLRTGPSAAPAVVPPTPTSAPPQTPTPLTPPPLTPATAAVPASPAPAAIPLAVEALTATPATTAGRPAGPTNERNRQEFDAPVGMGRRQTLLIDGPSVAWRGRTIEADEVTSIAYTSGDSLIVHLWSADTEMQVRLAGTGRNRDAAVPAWQALVRWTEALVEGRLVDRYLERLAEKGRVIIGDLVVTTNGVAVKGRVVPWSVLSDVEFDGRSVVISQRADALDGRTELARLDAGQPDVVLLPTLVAAAASSRSVPDAPG